MRKEDKKAIEINNFLRAKYAELSKVVGNHSNIIGVFYHELMIYFTNYLLIKNSNYYYNQGVDIPYLNTKYVEEPFVVKISNKEKNKIGLKVKILITLLKIKNILSFFYKKKIEVTILSNMFFGVKLLKFPLRYYINILNNNKCYIINYDEQLCYLTEILLELSVRLNINNKEVFVKNFINYIDPKISKVNIQVNSSVLIVGSNGTLVNRINSSNFIFQRKKVISLAHGEGCVSQLDDPYTGYGELSYSTDYITFGSHFLGESMYNLSLHKLPNIYQVSSPIINSIYKKEKTINHQSINNQTKILYIPTGFSENVRYGPFRDIDDEVYIKWQNALFETDTNIYYKARPELKNIIIKCNNNKVISKNLKKIINSLENYDIFFIDFFSTASIIISATNKPIIYFNLGLMNIADEALKDFKERVFWYDIDIKEDFNIQIENAIYEYNKSNNSFKNNYTSKYSLNEERYNSNIVDKIINTYPKLF